MLPCMIIDLEFSVDVQRAIYIIQQSHVFLLEWEEEAREEAGEGTWEDVQDDAGDGTYSVAAYCCVCACVCVYRSH